MASNLNIKSEEKKSIAGIISLSIAVFAIVLVLNFLFGIIPIEKIQGLPMVLPIIFGPLGAIIAFISYNANKDRLSLYGIILNIIVFLIPILYNVVGTLIFGV
ncbi:hypothetical protein V7150_13815 [Neobacillus drentensis]|uniref:hypothetical protein n=1 Tax=Neobacillus drentensis TaxID=220684 RepID=UPI002FFF492C